MEITIMIPEELTNQLHTDTQELERRVREKVAVELYQEGASEEQIRRLLNLDTRFEDIRELAKGWIVLQAVIGGVGLGEAREPAVVPGEPAGVHDDPTDRGPVSADKLGRRVDDYVRSMLKRVVQVR